MFQGHVVFCGLHNLYPSTCGVLGAIQPAFKYLYYSVSCTASVHMPVVFCGLYNLFPRTYSILRAIQPVFKYLYYSVSCTASVHMPVVFCGLYNLFPRTYSILRAIQPVFKCLYQCFPNVFAHRPYMALKNNHYRSSHSCAHKYKVSR